MQCRNIVGICRPSKPYWMICAQSGRRSAFGRDNLVLYCRSFYCVKILRLPLRDVLEEARNGQTWFCSEVRGSSGRAMYLEALSFAVTTSQAERLVSRIQTELEEAGKSEEMSEYWQYMKDQVQVMSAKARPSTRPSAAGQVRRAPPPSRRASPSSVQPHRPRWLSAPDKVVVAQHPSACWQNDDNTKAMIFGDALDFADIMSSIGEIEDRLNG